MTKIKFLLPGPIRTPEVEDHVKFGLGPILNRIKIHENFQKRLLNLSTGLHPWGKLK